MITFFHSQLGSPTCPTGVNTGGDQIRRQIEAQPSREGRQASRVTEDLIRGRG